MLSTIIITKNCAHTLQACLDSVQPISHEIIVVDSNSTDNTVEICRRYTSQIIQTQTWPGFGPQKQLALDHAQGPWVLSIDSDEILTPACQQAILTTMKAPRHSAYRIKRVMIFAGQVVAHSACSDAPVRLFKKDSANFSPDLVHESVLTTSSVGKINQPMWHYSYSSIGHWIEKMNTYSTLSGQKKTKKYHSVSYAVFTASLRFWKVLILKRGFLDGRLGIVAAINAAVAAYYKYLKLALDPQFQPPK
ncbi:MAG: hypothetical protein A3J38_03930 [Gammaproteobacteria bacterium RIFCSPHIGHO2_12_FULL_45_9]|nr:MAG: hypothetical protein A3J38_03930 [Gammaproteobacteria bacterium RIFCSPHIGHO2_12_FULL_45_9]